MKKVPILFRFKSIQTTILVALFGTVLVALSIFFLISLSFTEKSIVNNSVEYTKQLTKQVNNDMDSYITYLENISQMVTENNDVNQYLFGEEKIGQQKRILRQFQTIMDTREDITNVGVIGDDGTYVINKGADRLNPYVTISNERWYQEAKENRGVFSLSTSHIQNVIAGNYDWVITLSQAFINSETKEAEGVFFIDLNYNTIRGLCESVSLGDKGYIYVLDEKGRVIYHPQQQLLYSGLKTEVIDRVLDFGEEEGSFKSGKNKNSKVYTVSKSKKTGWTVVGVSYMSRLMEGRNNAQIIYVLVMILLLGISVFLAAILSGAITSPIKVLDTSMKEMQKGDFDKVVIDELGENEIGRLGASFNRMTLEIRNLMEENTREQREKRKAEMRALQSQIHPHFLYNTLDSIIWMAESGENNKEVVLMTSSLAKLLRQSIGNEEELITIGKELEYTKTYLTIQRIRYRDKLEFDIQVSPDIYGEHIVKLTLQPLVENAIYHGLKYNNERGYLQIRGFQKQEKIVLQVIDNGAGMEAEQVEHILEKRTPSPTSNGVGTYNVQNRLQLYYGEEYGLVYNSEPGVGTTVTIYIPREGGNQNATK